VTGGGHLHTGGCRHRGGGRALVLVIALTGGFMIVEFVGGLLTNSLALLSDAGHMLTDVAALSLALFAGWFATRPPTARKSFGFHRTEILAALVNGVAIVLIAVLIVIEAVDRLSSPREVDSVPMLAVAGVGLVVNLVAAWVLHRQHSGNLNIQGALLHVLGDLLGSLGAIAAGVVMLTTGFYLADPIVSFVIAALIIFSAVRLILRSVDVLLEGTPAHLDLEEIRRSLTEIPGVCRVHDLHVWTITSGFESLTAHLVLEAGVRHQEVLAASHEMLQERYGLDHSTLQPEEPGLDPCGSPRGKGGTGAGGAPCAHP
jgi:cobalt-zinc-cadmium efflux system protein